MSFIIRGILIGIFASIPIGPIAMMVIQKSFNHGWKAGFSCGMGCMIADFFYAGISVFALSWVSDFISSYSALIQIVGGIIVLVIGLLMALKNKVDTEEGVIIRKQRFSAGDTAKAASMALSNPGALAVMLALFAAFRMDTSGFSLIIPFLVVISVTAGSGFYWFGFSKLAAKFQDSFRLETLVTINKIAGFFIAAFGLMFILRGFGIITI